MLHLLRNFDADRSDVDEMVALLAFGTQLRDTYIQNDLETPEWVEEKLIRLQTEIGRRRLDNIERAIKEDEARLETLKTAQEKREETKERLERLRSTKAKILGVSQAAVGAKVGE